MTQRNFHIGKTPTIPAPSTGRAAAYVRMSTDHQRYSITNQMKALREYAAKHGIEISKVYEDAGKSGLNIEGRESLARLFIDILSGAQDFDQILVYDVSRWGRFQDVDESAYYEYLCRRRGVRVIYCAEPFENDASPLSAIVKAVKRAMAAEFSRELSAKIFAAKCHVVSLGHHPGGRCAYGLKRVAVDSKGRKRHAIARGHRKSVPTDHIVLAPGPRAEVNVVRSVFRMYVRDGLSSNDIARVLNNRGIKAPSGGRWHHTNILYMLKNEKYIGVLRYNRTSAKMKTNARPNDQSIWITVPRALRSVVSKQVFEKARDLMEQKRHRKPDSKLLYELKQYVRKHGITSGHEIRSLPNLSCRNTYIERFRSMRRVYQLIGHPMSSCDRWHDEVLLYRQVRTQVLHLIKEAVESVGGIVDLGGAAHNFRINDRLEGYLQVRKITGAFRGNPTWRVRVPDQPSINLHLIGLLDGKHPMPVEYFAIPNDKTFGKSFTLHSRDRRLDRYGVGDIQHAIESLKVAAAVPDPTS